MLCYNNIIKNTRDTKHYEQMIPNQMINKLKDCEVDFMKAVIAIDSFKGSLSSFEAGNSAAEGIRRVYPDAQIEVRLLADGGEGTVEALTLGCAGQLTTVTVTGPLGKPVSCQYGIVDSTRTAIIEMSGAAGITLVPDTERNPLYTTTYGVGEVIRDAITKGCRHFIVGIGGSATNDGGAGMVQALGVKLLDTNEQPLGQGGGELAKLARIDLSGLDKRLAECRIEVACDVTNPLTGDEGASAVFGPQKGATPEMIVTLDNALAHYAQVIARDLDIDVINLAGGGAAGGMGAALYAFCGAQLRQGIEIVTDALHLAEQVANADLVITGEGRIDSQTIHGKVPVGVAKVAKRFNKPVIGIAGSLTADVGVVHNHGIDAVFSVIYTICSLEDALENASDNVRMAARNIAAVLKVGQAFRL